MRAFLSHSSADKAIVGAVHDALERSATWLDRAEIEWGDLFLEKIADGIESASDFVLFWSAAAAKSAWVRLELNMAFVRLLREKAIRLRVVTLDGAPLPLYLKPFHVVSVQGAADPAGEIISRLTALIDEPVRPARSAFVNRHSEISRIEAAIDDPEILAVWCFGFTGIGKSSLVRESLRRILEGAEVVGIHVTEGTSFVELALSLNTLVRRQGLPESLSQEQIEREIRLSLERAAKEGRILHFSNVQHWLDEDAEPDGPLRLVADIVAATPTFGRHPVFLTSTRRPKLDARQTTKVALISVPGLDDQHTATVVKNWYYSIYGKELAAEDARRIAPKLFGHPVAARLLAGLLGDHSAEYLEKYPRELVLLRRDLARVLLQDVKLGPPAERLMELLALAGVGLPAPVIAANGFSDQEFQDAVEQCSRAGLITAEKDIEGHPLFQEFFWHHLHRLDYQDRAAHLADSLREHLTTADKLSPEYARLLPVVFRLYALAGNLAAATSLRRDLLGELTAAAIILYNRRNYALADAYIDHVLDADPHNWQMRLYRARLRVRQERWAEADRILSELLNERPGDAAALHAKGWRHLRQHKYEEALAIFSGVIARREHVRSMANAAECLYRMNRLPEALEFLSRAKARESENPFILDLESMILEDMGYLDAAYDSALLASARDPLNERLQHRLGHIRVKQGRLEMAIPHFQRSIELDPDQFSSANSLASAHLDLGQVRTAEEMLEGLVAKARTPRERALVEHTKARISLAKGDLDGSRAILNREIANSRNLLPNLGVLVQVELATFDTHFGAYPASADVSLAAAEEVVQRIVDADPDNRFIDNLKAAIEERRRMR